MNYQKLVIACLLFVFNFSGCRSDDEKNAELVRQLNLTDGFISNISFDTCHIKVFKKEETLLTLDSLNNGFDSIQLRIRYGCALEHPDKIIILSLTSGEWQAKIIEPEYHYSGSIIYKVGNCWVDLLDSISKKVRSVNPKSGWKNFITRLFALHILSLPNFETIQDYSDKQGDIMDGCGVRIEIATKKIHRIYDYDNPDFFVSKYQEAKNIIDIASLLNIEFDIKEKWPNYYQKKSMQANPDLKNKQTEM